MSRNTVKDEIVLERLDQYYHELNEDSKKIPGLVGRFVINRDDIFGLIPEVRTTGASERVSLKVPSKTTSARRSRNSTARSKSPSARRSRKSYAAAAKSKSHLARRSKSSPLRKNMSGNNSLRELPKIKVAPKERRKENTPLKKGHVGRARPGTLSRKLKFGGGRPKSKPKPKKITISLANLTSGLPKLKNNRGLRERFLDESYDSHKFIFEHYFGEFLRAGDGVNYFARSLEDAINHQTGRGYRLDVSQGRDSNLVVINFFDDSVSSDDSLFHLSIHRIGSGRSGFLGLVHVVSDEVTTVHNRHLWKNNVRLFLEIERQGNLVGLKAESSHNPVSTTLTQEGRNQPVRPPARAFKNHTRIKEIGVTVSRIFKQYIDSVSKIEIVP